MVTPEPGEIKENFLIPHQASSCISYIPRLHPVVFGHLSVPPLCPACGKQSEVRGQVDFGGISNKATSWPSSLEKAGLSRGGGRFN